MGVESCQVLLFEKPEGLMFDNHWHWGPIGACSKGQQHNALARSEPQKMFVDFNAEVASHHCLVESAVTNS